MSQVKIGIIGGSGLYQIEGLEGEEKRTLSTPFGKPSHHYVVGTLAGRGVAFLARHGGGHRFSPSDINYRANIYGFKMLGVEAIISVSAVGSMREERKPGDFVIPDQFFDRTKGRPATFFSDGIVSHVEFADPLCPVLSETLYTTGKEMGFSIYKGGTYLCIEGPQFSTRAESHIYRQWGVDVIGMTNLTEAKLAREAEICYSTLAMVTDYDCWHQAEESVSAELVMETMQKNTLRAKQLIARAIPSTPTARTCRCAEALKYAIVTDKALIPPETREKLHLLIGKYID